MALILIAHGSRDPRWREPFDKLYHDIRKNQPNSIVFLAYMEFCEPTLEQIAEQLPKGENCIELLPLFMAAGAHVANELTTFANILKARRPECHIELLPPIGECTEVQDAMRTHIDSVFASNRCKPISSEGSPSNAE